ncbi:MAG: pyridoxal phosphate-dependent class II aminotransferase [Cycloclasticus sp.]|jgi:Histidinol-phosphate/aromatic aminotransferase and cobyric acid decarboxylase
MSRVKLHQPLHGGDLAAASQRYGVATEDWLDLSTGINPEAYPFQGLSAAAFCQLPYLSAEFQLAAKNYYAVDTLLAVSGSQAVIQALPHILQQKTLLIPEVGYQEYAKHWRKAGGLTEAYPSFDAADSQAAIQQALCKQPNQHLLIINPNNPTGLQLSADELLHYASLLAAGAYLIVDEAFADLRPEKSVLQQALPDNVIVLRSFGKFFGLAGVRLGFVMANERVLQALNTRLGLWQINGPAQELAIKAFNDTAWQNQSRQGIADNASFCEALFEPLMQMSGLIKGIHCGLFSSYLLDRQAAYQIFEYFARAGILFRVVEVNEQVAILRIGLFSKRAGQHTLNVKHAVAAYCDAINSHMLTEHSVENL